MERYASKLVAVLMAEVGYLEKKSNSQLDSKTANAGYNNYTKYARDLDALGYFYNGPKNGYPYCDVTYDWAMVQAFGVDAALELLCQPTKSYGAGCEYSAQYYKRKGQFHKTGPKVGDQIFFWNSKKTEAGHTGGVVKVDNVYVYTVEGNTSGASGVIANGGGVFEKKYKLNDPRIYGYGRPNFDPEPEEEKSMKKVYIDPGHSINDPGAVGYEVERDLNEKTAKYMNEHLKANYVCETKIDPITTDSTSKVAANANAWGADLLVSIHNNAGGGDGYEALVYGANRKPLGQIFEKHVKAAGQNSRGIKYRPNLVVLKNSNMPAVLNEGAFVDNKKDIADWNDDHELKNLGIAYAEAAAEFLKLTKKVSAPSVETNEQNVDKAKTVTVELHVLSKGAEGNSVEAIQILLNGYNCNCGEVDGKFGANTVRGLNAFKSKNKLIVNGKCDADTWKKLLGV